MKKKLLNSGQTLIEIVVAIGIIALVLVGVSDLITRSGKVVSFQKQKDDAFNVAQKTLNDYRDERDADPQLFYDSMSSSIIDPCVVGKPYKCIVDVEKIPGQVSISIRVEWSEGGQIYNVTVSQALSTELK